MTRTDPNAALNRLFVILNRSFATYVADAAPWTHPGDEQARAVLSQIVAEQRHDAARVADLLLERRYPFNQGEYPMAFTDTHGLSLDYLVSELIYYQKQDLAAIGRCVADLSADLPARVLTQEILATARRHLESLQELTTQPA